MAKWASNNQKLSCRGVNENDLVMGNLLYQKSGVGVDFLQNCDLPPPLKVFSGQDKAVVSSMNRICGMMGREEKENYVDYGFDDEHEKLELLKALRFSQTRAREAEKRAATLAKERDSISKALMEDSLRLFAYRQWMRLLELQVSKLQSRWKKQQEGHLEDEGDNGIGLSWFVAIAFCLGLGVVGVGFAIGCKYLS